MKKLISMFCAGSLLTVAGVGAAVTPVIDESDHVIYASALTAEQEASFNARDGKISDFWSDWNGKDYAKLAPLTHYHVNRNFFDNGNDDCQLEVKLAAGAAGFYLYCLVTDDQFMMPPFATASSFDALDFLFDSQSPMEIKEQVSGVFGNSSFFFTSQQYKLFVGDNNTTPTEMGFVKVNAFAPNWDDVYSIDQLGEMGVKIEILNISSTQKVMEWFVPYAHLMGAGITSIEEGTSIAFCAGYNDRDAETGDLDCAIRLKGHADPISGIDYEDGSEDDFAARGEYWGEVIFTQSVTVGVNSIPALRSSALNGEIVSSEFYTLQGEKIAAKSISEIVNHSIVIQRSVLKNGNVVSARVPLSR